MFIDSIRLWQRCTDWLTCIPLLEQIATRPLGRWDACCTKVPQADSIWMILGNVLSSCALLEGLELLRLEVCSRWKVSWFGLYAWDNATHGVFLWFDEVTDPTTRSVCRLS